jgi:putative transposase
LWEGRFRSCLAESEHHLLACCRYIELNPVRAGIVSHPRQYRWSSYRVNAEGKASDLIVPHEVYRRLGRSADARREAYRALFHVPPDEIDSVELDYAWKWISPGYTRSTNRRRMKTGDPE